MTTLALSGSGNIVSDVVLSPDGSTLASISDSIRVGVLSIDELIEVAHRNDTRSLSDGECRQYVHVEPCG